MKPSTLFTKLDGDERAVSPVLGVALLIAITVILAGVVGFIVLGVDTGGPNTPSATLQFSQEDNANSTVTVKVTHEGGDKLNADDVSFTIDNSSTTVDSFETMTAGDSQNVTGGGSPGDEIRVIWNDPNSDKTSVLAEYTVE